MDYFSLAAVPLCARLLQKLQGVKGCYIHSCEMHLVYILGRIEDYNNLVKRFTEDILH